MRPRADEVMNTIISTYDQHVLPAIEEGFPKSLALTISNLLRHVQLRLEHEGPALVADNAELREVLGEIAAYLTSLSALPDTLDRQLDAVRQAAVPLSVNGYVSLKALTAEAEQLRSVLDAVLKGLQEHRATLRGNPAYSQVRDRIRAYLGHQLERESAWIRDAFTVARR